MLFKNSRDVTAKDKYFCENVHPIFCEHIVYSITDTNGVIINVSDAFCKETGYEREEIVGKTHSFLRISDFPDDIYSDLWDTISLDKTWQGQIKNIKKNGDYYWANSVIEPIYREKVKVGYISVRLDIYQDNNNNSFIEKMSAILDI